MGRKAFNRSFAYHPDNPARFRGVVYLDKDFQKEEVIYRCKQEPINRKTQINKFHKIKFFLRIVPKINSFNFKI